MTATLSSVEWAIGLVVAIVVIAALCVAVVLRRRATARAAQPTPATAPHPVDEPMIGLESALALVTDRDGRPMRERIDAETQHVDDLRVPDDTGPLLRRALDHVEHPGVEQHRATGDQAAHTPPGDPN